MLSAIKALVITLLAIAGFATPNPVPAPEYPLSNHAPQEATASAIQALTTHLSPQEVLPPDEVGSEEVTTQPASHQPNTHSTHQVTKTTAYNNRSDRVIESVSVSAVDNSPAIDPAPDLDPSSPPPLPNLTPTPTPHLEPIPTPIILPIPIDPPDCPPLPIDNPLKTYPQELSAIICPL